jgi:hypothetical protein
VQAVDPTVALAVGQQQLGFALVFGLENAYTFLDNKDGTPGRPSLPLAGGVVGAAVVVRTPRWRVVRVSSFVSDLTVLVKYGSHLLCCRLHSLRVACDRFSKSPLPLSTCTVCMLAELCNTAIHSRCLCTVGGHPQAPR